MKERKGPLLLAEHVTKTYRKGARRTEALLDVSLCLGQGEILGIVGESGSGKSTLLRQIGCLGHPDAGHTFLDGRDITRCRTQDICGEVQMIFQDAGASFPPHRRIGEVLEEAVRQVGHCAKAEVEARCLELVELVGLQAKFLQRYPAELSGGQCQRMAIARALAGNPRLLLCDECTSALDVMAQKQILELLQELNGTQGFGVLFVSHDLAVVSCLCDRVLVLENGRCSAVGKVGQILKRSE